MIGIIDYGLGNIKAFHNIYREKGINLKIIQNHKEINKDINRLILPGIGSFDKAILLLKKNKFFDEIINFVSNNNNKILGICVGMQILSSTSDEGKLSGFKFIDENFIKLKNKITPHIGWNKIEIIKQDALFENISDGTFFYFLHSYGLEKLHPNNTICKTEYGNKFVSVFNKKNIYGIQFHPEKSHSQGSQILLNFYKS